MKNKYILLLFGIVILTMFVACSNKTNENESTENINDEQNNEEEIVEEDPQEEGNDQEGEEVQEEPAEEKITATYEVNEGNWSIIPIDDANEQVVLLTIDDAPDKYALEMAETLEKLDVNAIFFVNGHFLETEEDKEALRTIYDKGFLIGNHTYNHPFLPDLTEEEQREEIVSLNDKVEEIIGERPRFFRAPHGGNTDYTKEVAKEEGMTLMNWSYGYDWEAEYQTKEALTDIMLNTELLGNGANLLMHDREWTAAALHDIVTGLKEKRYEIVDPKLIKTE